MRVTSDRQTLILAGETPPRRSGMGVDALAGGLVGDSDDGDLNSPQITIISARVDAVVTQRVYTSNQQAAAVEPNATDSFNPAPSGVAVATTSFKLPAVANSSASLPALPPRLHQAFVATTRGSSASALNAYMRTRDHSDRIPLIDTYA